MKKIKTVTAIFLVLLLSVSGCSLRKSESDVFGIQSTEFDYYSKMNGWKKYSTSTDFKLSDKLKLSSKSSIKVSDDKTVINEIYIGDFGSYPIIQSIGYGGLLSLEFARQHIQDETLAKNISNANPVFISDNYLSYIYKSMQSKPQSYSVKSEPVLTDNVQKNIIYECEGYTDLIIDPIEYYSSINDYKEKFDIETVAYDALVFFTGIDNPLNSITFDNVKEIYGGTVKKWSELGGDDKEIDVYGRGKGTVNQYYMEKQIMKSTELRDFNMIYPKSPYRFMENKYSQYPKEFKNSATSIGYASKFLVEKYYGDTVKILSIDDIAPTDENIRNQTYPYVINYDAVTYKNSETTRGKNATDWLLSDEGQQSIAQCGFVTLK